MIKFSISSFIILFILSITLVCCQKESKSQQDGETVYNTYCGSCHVLSSPENIPKIIWEESVLPEMAARMGYRYNGYSPYKYGPEENYQILLSNVYPQKPIIDSIQFELVKDYIMSLAPDSIEVRKNTADRNHPLELFKPQLEVVKQNQFTQTANTLVNFQEEEGKFAIANIYGQLYLWDKDDYETKQYDFPVIARNKLKEDLLITNIGNLNPSQVVSGSLHIEQSSNIDFLLGDIHRPVYTHIEDLNEDDTEEIIVCEFGHHTGQLSMLVENENGYEKQSLLSLPGSIKVEIADMNHDGKKDIIALFSQAEEGIYLFTQGEDLEFKSKRIIELPPEYGSSWFELLDYDGDGDLDVFMANGDNADYSIFLKPYHGVRLFLNDGNNQFDEKWFYPIYGATRVLADDFDKDGDFDFAVLSFFPDFEKSPQEGFVYLENKDAKNYSFEAQTTDIAAQGNWLTMDKGDIDDDGDVDILLGNFTLLGADLSEEQKQNDLLFLENQMQF